MNTKPHSFLNCRAGGLAPSIPLIFFGCRHIDAAACSPSLIMFWTVSRFLSCAALSFRVYPPSYHHLCLRTCYSGWLPPVALPRPLCADKRPCNCMHSLNPPPTHTHAGTLSSLVSRHHATSNTQIPAGIGSHLALYTAVLKTYTCVCCEPVACLRSRCSLA